MRTYAKKFEKGRPWSRAKAQVRRDTEAKMPNVDANAMTRIVHIIAVAALVEPVAW